MPRQSGRIAMISVGFWLAASGPAQAPCAWRHTPGAGERRRKQQPGEDWLHGRQRSADASILISVTHTHHDYRHSGYADPVSSIVCAQKQDRRLPAGPAFFLGLFRNNRVAARVKVLLMSSGSIKVAVRCRPLNAKGLQKQNSPLLKPRISALASPCTHGLLSAWHQWLTRICAIELSRGAQCMVQWKSSEVHLGADQPRKGTGRERTSGEAKELLTAKTQRKPGRRGGPLQLGRPPDARGKRAGAIAAYERALAVNPSHAEAHNNLGVALDAQRRYAEAAKHFRKAIGARPNYTEAHFNLGLAFFRANDNIHATQEFEKALKLDHARSGRTRSSAKLYLRQGKRAQAVKHSRRPRSAGEADGNPTRSRLRG